MTEQEAKAALTAAGWFLAGPDSAGWVYVRRRNGSRASRWKSFAEAAGALL